MTLNLGPLTYGIHGWWFAAYGAEIALEIGIAWLLIRRRHAITAWWRRRRQPGPQLGPRYPLQGFRILEPYEATGPDTVLVINGQPLEGEHGTITIVGPPWLINESLVDQPADPAYKFRRIK
jgi:hypothetical protein